IHLVSRALLTPYRPAHTLRLYTACLAHLPATLLLYALRGPPRPTLFPYTTLFRSHLAREPVGVDDHAPEPPEDLGDGGFAGRDAPRQPHEQEPPRHASAQSAPDFTSTTRGIWSGSAISMISRTRASTAGTSSGGASKRSSSWTC